jgi:hypothetical protein
MLNLAPARPAPETRTAFTALVVGPPCRVLVNFAAPLTPELQAAIEKYVGAEIIEVNLSAHFDFARPLRPQVHELTQKMMRRLTIIGAPQLDYLIPPAFPAAAHLVAEFLARADSPNPLGLIWLRRVEGAQPVQYVLGGIE